MVNTRSNLKTPGGKKEAGVPAKKKQVVKFLPPQSPTPDPPAHEVWIPKEKTGRFFEDEYGLFDLVEMLALEKKLLESKRCDKKM